MTTETMAMTIRSRSREDMEILSGKDLDLDTLVSVAEELAKNFSDGHLTVMRFTTGWKCVLGTPCFDSLRGDREIVWHLPSFATPQDALMDLILKGQRT